LNPPTAVRSGCYLSVHGCMRAIEPGIQ
jgi:hypothetical protein